MARVLAATLALLFGWLATPGWAQDTAKPAGFVDGAGLVATVGEEHVRLRVSLSGALLRALSGGDPELKALVSGLDSIQAVILDLADPARGERARKAARDLEGALRSRGWEEVAVVREEDSEIRVLVLSGGEKIRGLVVFVLETGAEEPQLVFANLAGEIDLAAIQKVGEGFNVPGLQGLELK